MERLGPEHIEFLRTCAAKPVRTHSSNLPEKDLDLMAAEGLLISYNRATGKQYAITSVGSQVVKSYGAPENMIKIARDFVISKGYDPEAAAKIVSEHGVETILKSKDEELKTLASGQREVTVPMDEQ